MEQTNPKMIEIGRLSRGYTQKDLASFLPNLSQPNLSKVEKGILGVTDETLKQIASALNYPVTFFYLDDLKTPFSSLYFRKRASVSQKGLDKIFADLKIILKSIDLLLADIDLKEYPKYSYNLTDGWEPEDVAVRIREMFKIKSGAIQNLVKLIEEEGVIVYFYDSKEEKFDGLTSYTDKGIPVIFVNRNMPNDRIRFTICHELGHLIMHIPCDVEPWRDAELEANKFAAEFLMPKRDCAQDLRNLSYVKLANLKTFWGVSKAAIIRRAKTLQLINDSTYQYLMIELGRRNERKNETGFVENDEPRILSNVIELLKSELGYSDENISSNLCVDIRDYQKLFDDKTVIRFRPKVLKNAI